MKPRTNVNRGKQDALPPGSSTIEGGSRIATGAIVFNGARIETGAEVEFNAVVYVNTVVRSGTAVPMGWFAGGDPAELVAPSDWDRIHAIMGPLDYPGTISGVETGHAGTQMADIARCYARGWPCMKRSHSPRAVPPARRGPLGLVRTPGRIQRQVILPLAAADGVR